MIRAGWERLRDPSADTTSPFIVTYEVTLLSKVSRFATLPVDPPDTLEVAD
jgi:hypothetical protein